MTAKAKSKAKPKGLRPKVIECEECGELVQVKPNGKVPRWCNKHSDPKTRPSAKQAAKSKTAPGISALSGEAAAALAAPAKLAQTAWQLRQQRRKQGRPSTIACEVCGESVPVAAKAQIPRFCKKHRNNKNRPPVGVPRAFAAAPAAAAVKVGKRTGRRSTFELARQALQFAGLRIARSLDTSEGVMLLVRRHTDSD